MVGLYVGIVTAAGFIWWFVAFEVRVGVGLLGVIGGRGMCICLCEGVGWVKGGKELSEVVCAAVWGGGVHEMDGIECSRSPSATHAPPSPTVVPMQGGPQISWTQLRGFLRCGADGAAPCDIFKSRHPSTISMTVLVIVEMFNALNALSGV